MILIVYIFLFFVLMAALLSVIRLFKVRVWIYARIRQQARVLIGYMNYRDNNTVPEVFLVGHSKGAPIGRVKFGDDDDNCHVEILVSDLDVEPSRAQYRTYGFITQEGLIYKQVSSSRRPELVGYTARPSSPLEPTVVGERSWRSLWLKCRLNAYMGVPNRPDPDASTDNERNAASPDGKDGTKKKPRPVPKEAVASCFFSGFHSSKTDVMPPEARAAAYSVLFGQYNKNDYHEYYNSPAYGWRDTALLSTTIYAVVYCLWYIICVKILGIHFIGYRYWLLIPAFGMFFILWAIIRAVKIEFVENSNTIQPKIDLFNKSLGQFWSDALIVICCVVLLLLSGYYYRLDFMALALAVLIGVCANMSLRSSRRRWEVNNPYAADAESDDLDEVRNPEGDIARNYEWRLDSDSCKDVTGSLTLYFNAQYMADLRYMNPFYGQRSDKPVRVHVLEMFRYMKEHKGITARLRYVARQIKQLADQNDLTNEESLQFTLDFVQEPNIRFTMNRDSKAINNFEDYIRFPDEVFFDKEADSNSKALLAAMLFHYMRHNTLFLFSRLQKHAAVGVEVMQQWIDGDLILGHKMDEVTFVHGGRRYVFCETTGDHFRIGGTMAGMRYSDFDEQVELPLNENDLDDSNEETVTQLYNWDLDSEQGTTLHGCYTLEFNVEDIERLRRQNPFRTYGMPGDMQTYDEKVRTIFSYLSAKVERSEKVRELVGYIRHTAEQNHLSGLDVIQFVLDFVQEPNITYRVDEESVPIRFAKEYMRFPDEVLMDKEGDCDCKSSLMAALLHELGYNIVVLLSEKLGHAAIAIETDDAWLGDIKIADRDRVIRQYNGKEYIFCETTGDGYRVGHIQDQYSIQDFETIVEINSK